MADMDEVALLYAACMQGSQVPAQLVTSPNGYVEGLMASGYTRLEAEAALAALPVETADGHQ